MAGKSYESLNDTDRVRVNAVILTQFKAADPKFMTAFREEVTSNPKGRKDGFQDALDAMRNRLAADIANIPTVNVNADKKHLIAQTSIFLSLKKDMAAETKGQEYSAAQIAEKVQNLEKAETTNGPLAISNSTYTGQALTAWQGQMLAQVEARNACKIQLKCNDNKKLTPPPERFDCITVTDTSDAQVTHKVTCTAATAAAR